MERLGYDSTREKENMPNSDQRTCYRKQTHSDKDISTYKETTDGEKKKQEKHTQRNEEQKRKRVAEEERAAK